MNDDGDREDLLTEVEKDLLKRKREEQEELRGASGVISDKGKAGGGALNKLITISEEARQILAGANHRDPEEADLVTAALAEARRYGCNDGLILDYVASHCGVSSQSMSKTEWGVRALTHFDFNQPEKGKWWKGQKKEEKTE